MYVMCTRWQLYVWSQVTRWKYGCCTLVTDSSDMYNAISSEYVKHIAFCFKSRDTSGISVVGWKHINAFSSVYFSRKCLAKQLLQKLGLCYELCSLTSWHFLVFSNENNYCSNLYSPNYHIVKKNIKKVWVSFFLILSFTFDLALPSYTTWDTIAFSFLMIFAQCSASDTFQHRNHDDFAANGKCCITSWQFFNICIFHSLMSRCFLIF